MTQHFKLKTVNLAILIAFSAGVSTSYAAEAYPALPPSLSTSVPPNVMFFIDTSGSMLQDENNAWMLTGVCNSNTAGWNNCVDNNTNGYRTQIDSMVTSPNTKMNIAKRVVTNLVNNNPDIRFGLFSFEDKVGSIGGPERGQGSIKRADIKDLTARTYPSPTPNTTAAMAATNKASLIAAISALNGRTSTPLGEGLLEITRYFGGMSSLYKTGTYTSPIQYRCQKNFALVITDGDATDDETFAAQTYTSRDATGAATTRTMNVCTVGDGTTTGNDQTVNCPAGLETTSGTFTAAASFGDGTNRPRALRDIAKFGQVADLRVGGTDLDGRSFDASPFFKQNLATYTVGFTVANAVLPAAAVVGGGRYYNANNEAQLASSLAGVINSINASTSNAGGVAAQSEVTTVGNNIFQPVFNPNGWYGELRCFNLVNNALGAACTPNAKAVIPVETSRNIYSSKVVAGVTTPFAFNDSTGFTAMTANQKAVLGADATAQKNTIKFLRGVEGIAGFRSRPIVDGVKSFLGDIVDGQPVVVTPPGGFTNAADYNAFKTANSARNMVLVGANDGMLHAFNIGNMTELAAYIPSGVFPHLKALTASDYGVSGGTDHTYHVNGSIANPIDYKPSAAGAWKTMVVGGLGQGGQGHYALDVTNTTSLGAATTMVKWDYTDVNDSEIGYSMGLPIISNVRTSATTTVPAVIFSNGYENSFDDTASGGQKTASNTSALYIVKADDGTLLKKISLPTSGTYISQGLSAPWGVDIAQDGILDYVYAGDVNGNMWRFDLTADVAADFKVATNAGGIAVPIFKAPAGQPITMRPASLGVASSTGTGIGNMVLFGTGQLLKDADRSTTTTQALYGVLDKMASSITTLTIASNFQQQTITDEYTLAAGTNAAGGTYRKVSTNDIDVTDPASTMLGWYINLPTLSERMVITPRIYNNRVNFGTGIPIATEKCTPGGDGWIMGLNPLTGSVVTKNNQKPSIGIAFSFLDINLDGKSSAADRLAFPSGAAYASGFKTPGIPTELTFIATSSALTSAAPLVGVDPYDGSGGFVAMREANSQGVGKGYGGGGTQGTMIPRIDSGDEGTVCSGTVGSDSVSCRKLNKAPTTGVKVESSTWREIK
ncbi:pilus assembly protein [Rhodoferax saidenbachensis]|nr:PilC/PilY family type IV pilus protein [Rhodoferax saidenbachensis]